MVSEPVSEQIGTGKKSRNRYRNKLVPEKSLGTSIGKILYREKVSKTGIGKIWHQKIVSEPVLENFDTGTDFRRQNLGTLNMYNGYRYRIGTVTGTFSFFSSVIRTGIEKIWYRKKSRKQSRKNFGSEKSVGTGLEKF